MLTTANKMNFALNFLFSLAEKYKYSEKVISQCEAKAVCLKALSIMIGDKVNNSTPPYVRIILLVTLFISIPDTVACKINVRKIFSAGKKFFSAGAVRGIL